MAFSEWEVARGEVPCSRAVFERLLRQQHWEIHPALALAHGLMLRMDIEGDESVRKLLSREQSFAFDASMGLEPTCQVLPPICPGLDSPCERPCHPDVSGREDTYVEEA